VEQPDVILFENMDSFRSGHCGALWATSLLNSYCQERWALVVDADELLVWPGSEHESIGDLTRRLDKRQARTLFVIMLDMYSDKPFGSVGYVRGEPLLEAAPFFDREPYGLGSHRQFPHRVIYGGPRGRAFPALQAGRCNPPTNSKVPLVRWQPGQVFGGGQHTLAVPMQLAPMRGAILHFKMLDDAPARCEREFARGEHWGGAMEQRALALMIEQAPNHCFFDPSYSVRYIGTQQLVALGLMREQDPFGALEPWTGSVE
jgi:hypothetical protein